MIWRYCLPQLASLDLGVLKHCSGTVWGADSGLLLDLMLSPDNQVHMCAFVCIYLCVYECFVSMCACACACASASVFLCLCEFVYVCVCVCVPTLVSACHNLGLSVPLYECLSVSLCLSMSAI